MRRFVIALVSVMSVSCQPRPAVDARPESPPVRSEMEKAAVPAPAAAPAMATPVKLERFGAALSKSEPIPLAKVLSEPDTYDGRSVVVDGYVRRACTHKGCWMEIAPLADQKGQGCRVTFKDYGFFVPTDSAGATARVEGAVAVKRIAAEEVAHLEGEGATFAQKAADGSAREVRLVATGVELQR